MSARHHLPARTVARRLERALERDALAAALQRHAPRGAVRAAEALAAAAMNRRRRAERIWNGAFADTPPGFDAVFAGLPEQPTSVRADAAWNAICRRIAARALAGAGPDPTAGAHCAVPSGAPAPVGAPILAAIVGPYAFYRAAHRPQGRPYARDAQTTSSRAFSSNTAPPSSSQRKTSSPLSSARSQNEK